MTLKELRERKGKLHADMTAISKRANDENRFMNQDEQKSWDTMDADYNQVDAEIQRREKMEAREKSLAEPVPVPAAVEHRGGEEPAETSDEAKRKQDRAFRAFLRYGIEGLQPADKTIMQRRLHRIDSAELGSELRDYTPQTVTTTGGGYLIPQGFSGELEKQLKEYGGVRSVARSYPTASGNDIPWPTVDDTGNVGELVAINTPATGQATAYGEVILKSFKFSSKPILLPLELMQDSFFDIWGHLQDVSTERLGRIENTYFTTGTGSGQPQGVVNGSTLGVTGATGTATSITNDGLLDLIHSVDPAYRTNARFMLNDLSLKAIKKLVDEMGRPLWLPSIVGGAPDTIHGYGYTINQDMANMAAAAKSVLFGAFQKFVVRDVMPPLVVRITEKYIESGQVAFLIWHRCDARYINTSAVKYYANGAAS